MGLMKNWSILSEVVGRFIFFLFVFIKDSLQSSNLITKPLHDYLIVSIPQLAVVKTPKHAW